MPVSETRAPTVAVYANSVPVAGILSAEIDCNSHLAANRFSIRASLTASGAALWAQDALQLDIRYGFGGGAASLMLGDVDRIEIDAIHGEVRADGRDLTSRLISARVQEAFENQTASQVASVLAARQGLAALVTPTTQPIGRYYQNGHTRTALDQHGRATTAWDMLARLAEVEGYDVWVDGQTLNFSPAALFPGAITLTPADCLSLQLQKSVGLSQALEVVVKSWDCRGLQSVEQRATSGSSGASGATPTSYVMVRPNLTSVAAQSLAQSTLNQMVSHALSISLEMPGDLTTTPRMRLTLADTGTEFDGVYAISSVERHVSFEGGFTQHVQARSPYWTVSST